MQSLLVNSELIEQKEKALCERIQAMGSMIVAYSGGVDSSTLAYYARAILGANARIVIAVSASLALDALQSARGQAAMFDWDLIEVDTGELDLDEYRSNDNMRCFFCKATLFERLQELARQWGVSHIAYGANLDDDRDYRPGHMAAEQFAVVSPLREAGLSKDEIRYLAKEAGLPSWNRPQDACLSSRVPTSIPVTRETLFLVERAESFIRAQGFRQVRVRHFASRAVVEVGGDELYRFVSESGLKEKVEAELRAMGYEAVEIDPDGYRQGAVSAPNFARSVYV
ncbi:MAG: ATP-dependent sacrificial sulfur transferase LarE [Candidatus Obscuribacterales bacterium]